MVSLFAPNDYSTRSAAISRQKKLADALAQIAQQETPVSTVGGITAPISPYSGLVKGLTSFGGSYLARKASEEEAALKKEQGEARAKALESFFEKPEKRGLVTSEAETTRPYQATFQAPTLPGMPAPEAVTAELQMPVSPTTQAGMIPGGPTSYADKVRMAYQFATGDDERLAALAPTLLTAAQPKIENIGARGSIVQYPLTGEMEVVGVPPEESEVDRKIQNVGGRSREVIKTPTGIKLGADYGPATDGTNVTVKLPPGINKADETLGAMYAEYITGDTADVQKNMNQLGMTIKYMEKDPKMFGNLSGALPVQIRAMFPSLKPGANVQQMVQEVVQTNLRRVLGPQFTAKEGEGLMNRIIDPQQPTAVNADRVRRLLLSIQQAAQAKDDAMRYFGQNNTISNYKPKYAMVRSLDDIITNAGLSGVDVTGAAPGTQPRKPGVDYKNPHLGGG